MLSTMTLGNLSVTKELTFLEWDSGMNSSCKSFLSSQGFENMIIHNKGAQRFLEGKSITFIVLKLI